MTGPRRDAPSDRLAHLYDQFAGTLFRYAAMLLADRAAAADAVHQVFLRLTKSGACERGPGPGEPYLRRAVRNECYSLLRARRRDLLIGVDTQLLELVAGEEDRTPDRLAIEQAFRGLPPEQREVVHLRVWEGMTFQEIADVTGESLNTAASRYRYATEKLRAILTKKS